MQLIVNQEPLVVRSLNAKEGLGEAEVCKQFHI